MALDDQNQCHFIATPEDADNTVVSETYDMPHYTYCALTDEDDAVMYA